MLGTLLDRITLIAICFCVTGCAEIAKSFVEGIPDSLIESNAEAKRKQQDRALAIEEIDRKRQEENLRDIERQNKREEAAKKKQFDEMFQKQMQKQQ
ncbi:MAG: hypothetical protein RW306_08635 [Geobacteraceae bacterium]|nr:hypothetical protein [Geobacteraceae bacterium]